MNQVIKPDAKATLAARRCAVIVIDPQYDFCSEKGALAQRFGFDMKDIQGAIPNLNVLIESARGHGVPVIWVRAVYSEAKMRTSHKSLGRREDGLWIIREGTKGVEWYKGVLAPLETESVITKWHYDAFEDTDLSLLLESHGITTVAFTGFTTNVCVETSARHAYIKGYNVILVTDCCGAPTRREHESALFNIGTYFGRLTTADELSSEWGATSVSRRPPKVVTGKDAK